MIVAQLGLKVKVNGQSQRRVSHFFVRNSRIVEVESRYEILQAKNFFATFCQLRLQNDDNANCK